MVPSLLSHKLERCTHPGPYAHNVMRAERDVARVVSTVRIGRLETRNPKIPV